MLVHLAEIGDNVLDQPVARFRRLAALDGTKRHTLTDDPEAADLILFSQCHMLPRDWRLTTIARHPFARKFRSKIRVYDERDRPWRAFSGVYVSMPRRWFDGRYQRAWAYADLAGESSFGDTDPDLLFSLVASPTHPSREPLFGLRAADAVVQRVTGFTFWDPSSRDYNGRKAHYAAVLRRSRFVLCPRGQGTSSIRLYESISAGRVPVVISDDSVEPPGPDWSAFTVRWPEGRVDGLIEELQARDSSWDKMSEAARSAFQEYFEPTVAFDRIVSLCAEPQAAPPWHLGMLRQDARAASRANLHGRVPRKLRRAGRRLLTQCGAKRRRSPST